MTINNTYFPFLFSYLFYFILFYFILFLFIFFLDGRKQTLAFQLLTFWEN